MDKIDILMATYNGEKYIAEQLESILNQTYKNFRLIISDDRSTDNTVNIIKKYLSKDSRIIFYEQKKNIGYNKNFEFLASIAESDFVMFSDQDDVWHLDKIKLMLDYIKQTKAVLVYCDMFVVDENLNICSDSFHKSIKRKELCIKYKNFELLKVENAISGCSMIVKREILKKSIPFNTSKEILYDYWISIISSQYGNIEYLDKPLQKYRQHQHNIIGIKKSAKILDFNTYRKNVINSKINQYSLMKKNIKKFLLNNKDIKYYYNSVLKVKNGKKSWGILKLYNRETFKRLISMILLYNFPLIGKILYNIKYKLQKQIDKK